MLIKYQMSVYKFNTQKFLMCLSNGETFSTDYLDLTLKKKNNILYWNQSFSYQIDENFIRNNFDKLLKLEIISLKN
jgi:hypothetical protein